MFLEEKIKSAPQNPSVHRAAGALRPKVGRVQSAKKNHVRGYIYRRHHASLRPDYKK